MAGRDAITAGEASELAGEFLEASAAYASVLDDADPAVVADAHFHLARVHWKQSRYDDAVAEFERARVLALQHDLRELRARVENGQGIIHQSRGEMAQAKACYALALDLATDLVQRGRITLNLGVIANIEGDFALARTQYARSRTIFQQAGFATGEVMALHNLGMLEADEGHWDEAEDAYGRSLELLEQIGDRQLIGTILVNRSELSCARGRFDEAVARCDVALSIYAEVGDEAGRGEAMRWKGRALRGLKQHADAERFLHDAIRIAKRTGVRLLEAEAAFELGASCSERGDQVPARRWLTRALELFESLGAQRDVDAVRAALAELPAPD